MKEYKIYPQSHWVVLFSSKYTFFLIYFLPCIFFPFAKENVQEASKEFET